MNLDCFSFCLTITKGYDRGVSRVGRAGVKVTTANGAVFLRTAGVYHKLAQAATNQIIYHKFCYSDNIVIHSYTKNKFVENAMHNSTCCTFCLYI
jgi:hypothetical protein